MKFFRFGQRTFHYQLLKLRSAGTPLQYWVTSTARIQITKNTNNTERLPASNSLKQICFASAPVARLVPRRPAQFRIACSIPG